MPKANEGHTFGTRFTTQAQGGFTYFTNFRANPSSTLKGLNIHVMSTGGNQEVTSHNNTIGGGADTRGAGMFGQMMAMSFSYPARFMESDPNLNKTENKDSAEKQEKTA